MSKLTDTHSEVSEIDFTTLTTVPGTLKVHGAPIQILDLRTFNLSSNKSISSVVQPESSKALPKVEVEENKASTCNIYFAPINPITQ